MKKILFILLSCLAPLALFANDAGVETDILQRTVNFLIFVAILYYLLADTVKFFLLVELLLFKQSLIKYNRY